MKLSILLPTYNREPFLIKNLEMLTDYIRKGQFQSDIELVISNNKSPDKTEIKVKEFINGNGDIQIEYFNQEENIGLEKNALFVLGKAKGEFVMYLGDDDYIEYEYLRNTLNFIDENPNTSVVIPSFVPIDTNGIQIGKGRDEELPNSYTKAGFKNCLKNSWRGHQLSGLVLKRNGLLDAYEKYEVQNIYPFIFFVAYSSLYGDTFHLTEFPVKVIQPGQENKDWNYGKDGLLNEVFDNYKRLPLNGIQKARLQLFFYKRQSWRLWNYGRNGFQSLLKAYVNIWFCDNSITFFKIIFPILAIYQYLSWKIKSAFRG
ncbi:glycosyltransferase family 2 protein [Draconibacterium halophilum]|uniref:Glycosyltransferase family 2 protein n=1 Tax=Draconibacterium halophilum TaxID=2706887 RepID=A0A6C0R9C6_9BACT|nr:glycosyltransferase family 2 protein [Draconibacterium halophilum]QIA06717.1 glycosyltransferase family 2 protein [Draconibacterium halophilum]